MSPIISKIIVDAAKYAGGVDPLLAISIAEVESAGDTDAYRYEPDWQYFLTPDVFARRCNISEETELISQATSWGLMQVMGGVARELGYDGKLNKLCDPRLGAKYGCLKLAQLMKRFKTLDEVISAYNCGTPKLVDGKFKNQSYVDKVRKAYGRKPEPY